MTPDRACYQKTLAFTLPVFLRADECARKDSLRKIQKTNPDLVLMNIFLRTCLIIPILVGAEVTRLKLFQENAGSWPE